MVVSACKIVLCVLTLLILVSIVFGASNSDED